VAGQIGLGLDQNFFRTKNKENNMNTTIAPTQKTIGFLEKCLVQNIGQQYPIAFAIALNVDRVDGLCGLQKQLDYLKTSLVRQINYEPVANQITEAIGSIYFIEEISQNYDLQFKLAEYYEPTDSDEAIEPENCSYNFPLLPSQHLLYSEYFEKLGSRDRARAVTIKTLEIKRSHYRSIKEKYQFQLRQLDEKSLQGQSYLDAIDNLNEAIASGEIKSKEAHSLFAKKSKKTAAQQQKDAEFHQYWSKLNFNVKLKLARLSFAKAENWILNFIGATWEQIKKISQLPKITKAAIAKIIQPESIKPAKKKKITYKQPLIETWQFLELNADKLGLSAETLASYKDRGFEDTFEVILALEEDNYPIEHFISKRSKRPEAKAATLTPEDIEKLLAEKESEKISDLQQQLTLYQLENNKYKQTIDQLEADIESKKQELISIKEALDEAEQERAGLKEEVKKVREEVKLDLLNDSDFLEKMVAKIQFQHQSSSENEKNIGSLVKVSSKHKNYKKKIGEIIDRTEKGQFVVRLQDCFAAGGKNIEAKFNASELTVISAENKVVKAGFGVARNSA